MAGGIARDSVVMGTTAAEDGRGVTRPSRGHVGESWVIRMEGPRAPDPRDRVMASRGQLDGHE